MPCRAIDYLGRRISAGLHLNNMLTGVNLAGVHPPKWVDIRFGI